MPPQISPKAGPLQGPGNRNYNQVKERAATGPVVDEKPFLGTMWAGDYSPGTKMFLEPTLLLKSLSDH